MKRRLIAVVICAGFLVPTGAHAQTADSGYASVPGISEVPSGPGGSSPTTRVTASQGDTLAFTGRDTRTLSALGVLLVGAGVLVRRRTRGRT